MSIETAIVFAYLRRARKPGWSDPDRFARRLHEPEGDAGPPVRLRQRHTVTERMRAGFRCVTVAPRIRATGRSVLYLHGGGYISEIAPQHWTLISKLASAGATVHVPLYGLAPQHTFTEAYALLGAVYEGLTDDAAQLTIMGDSAGGGLALGFTQTLRDAGKPLPRGLTLITPWLDIACRSPRIAEIEPHDPWLAKTGAVLAGKAWAGGADPDDPRLSPIRGDMTGLPPIDAYYGTRDITYADGPELQRLCREAGTRVNMTVAEGLYHVYPLMPIRQGRRARRRIIARAAGVASR